MQHYSDPLVDQVELLTANPNYAIVKLPSGRETTVSLKDLAPCPPESPPMQSVNDQTVLQQDDDGPTVEDSCSSLLPDGNNRADATPVLLRRSIRVIRLPERLDL